MYRIVWIVILEIKFVNNLSPIIKLSLKNVDLIRVFHKERLHILNRFEDHNLKIWVSFLLHSVRVDHRLDSFPSLPGHFGWPRVGASIHALSSRWLPFPPTSLHQGWHQKTKPKPEKTYLKCFCWLFFCDFLL